MMLIVASAILAGLAVLGVLMMFSSVRSGERRLGARMQTYLGSTSMVIDVAAHSSDDDPELAQRLNSTLERLSASARIQRSLDQANVPLTISEYLLLKAAAALLPVALVLFLTQSLLVAPVAGLLGFYLPTMWLNRRQRTRRRRFEEQLPDMLSTLISSLQAGFSLVQSIANVGREAPEPTGAEMRRVLQEIQLGVSVEHALNALSARMENQDLLLIIAVLNIHTRVGGNLTDVLRNISRTIRERIRLHRDVQVITSQQRYASYVLGLLPVILSLILMAINPSYMLKLFQPGWTLCIPFGAVVMNVLGFVVIRKIVDIKV